MEESWCAKGSASPLAEPGRVQARRRAGHSQLSAQQDGVTTQSAPQERGAQLSRARILLQQEANGEGQS